jgi:hypothetical protein
VGISRKIERIKSTESVKANAFFMLTSFRSEDEQITCRKSEPQPELRKRSFNINNNDENKYIEISSP